MVAIENGGVRFPEVEGLVMSGELLEQHRQLWQEKPVLRAIYEDYYRRMVSYCVPGTTLEIGGGSGNLKAHRGDVISTDIVQTPWLDAAADAQSLPFRDAAFSNILAVDVLHHIECQVKFFTEAERVLAAGGRIVLLEPGISTISALFYRFFHPEPVDMTVEPFEDIVPDPDRRPFDANQAIPTLLFIKRRDEFEAAFPGLRVLHVEWLSLFAYPLSGGFRKWNLIPLGFVGKLLQLEDCFVSRIGRFLGFRLLIVLGKEARQ
jgi:SAM-dependent methyltransferase